MKLESQSISEDLTVHVVSRCTNREFLFKNDDDFTEYLNILEAAKTKFGFEINNFTLMSNHCHLILTIKGGLGLPQIMKWLNGLSSTMYNKRHNRSSHFWRARYKSKPINDDRYGLGCMRYQHRNPVRAGITNNPGDWKWSSYKYFAYGEPNPLITPIPSYLALSFHPQKRQKIYRDFVLSEMPFDNIEKNLFTADPKRGRPYIRQNIDTSEIAMNIISYICFDKIA